MLAALATTATACTEDSAAPTEARGRIAFLATMGEDRATELRVVDVQDGGTRLAVAADSTNAPHWSPDGSRLVFVGRRQGRVGLMLARTDVRSGKPNGWRDGLVGIRSSRQMGDRSRSVRTGTATGRSTSWTSGPESCGG